MRTIAAPRPVQLRSLAALATTGIAIGAVVVSSLGVADAANGGHLVLGHANSATKTTRLVNSHGTPLSLTAGKGMPPLAVNSTKQVPHLNSSYVDGLTTSQLQRPTTGSCATGLASLGATGTVTCVSDRLIFTTNGTFTVPAGVTSLQVDLTGAGGGGGSQPGHNPQTASGGGAGSFIEALITVTAGEKLLVDVGKGGLGGTTTGQNGTASDISTDATSGSGLAQARGGEGGGSTGCDTPPATPVDPGAGGFANPIQHDGVIGITYRDGAPGDCDNGGGRIGYAGQGGVPVQDGQTGGNGQDGLVVISEG